MELNLEATATAKLKQPLMIGPGPQGVRLYIEVGEGSLTGPRLNGTVLPGGGDWVLVGADGWCRVDVRTQFETDDGAVIYGQFFGLIEMNDAVENAFASGIGTSFDDQYFRVTPRLETGDTDYEWVNKSVFLAQGRFVEGFGLEYQIYRVT
jgi:hypothetical protein